jgi:stage II sporulation protein D
MLRTLLALTGLALAVASSASAAPRAPAPTTPAAVTATTFVVSGRGWGHGVGLSQYGALGYANEGWTYDRILAHYYTGTELGPAGVARVRVLVAESKPSVRVRSDAPFRVRDVFGKVYPLAAGEVALGPKLRVMLNGVPTELAGPLLFLPGTAALRVDRPYRGQIEVSVAAGKLNAVNVVGLEQYLYGVVPKEMPSAWPDEALKAQAVAARSYALNRRVGGKGFDLYADVRSQVYGGIDGEHPRATAAIEATAGEVLLWEGKPIDALFHSTSGGATLDVAEVFGKPVPYLVGVDDPWSSLSPVHRWGPVAVPEAVVRKGLKLRSPVTALKLVRGASGRVATAEAVTAAGPGKVSGATLRAAAGLRSTWITQLASLSLTRPGGPAIYGRPVTVTGSARGLKGAVLSERVEGVWKPVGKPGTAFTVRRKVRAPATFRLSAGKVTGPVLKVPVAPVVTAKLVAGTVRGVVRPSTPGTTVELQLDSERGWWTMVQTTTGAAGEYSFNPSTKPGTYRVRVAPASGLAQGLSAPIELR